jgi:hypothetical protein
MEEIMTDQERISALETEIKRLKIQLDTLLEYLTLGFKFEPRTGRKAYDALVKNALKKQDLHP